MSSQLLGRIFQLLVVIGVAVLALTIVFGAVEAGAREHVHWFNNHQDYAPEQPIHFSHVTHAGALDIQCEYCHTSADQWRHATIPPLSTCMNCHGTAETQAAAKERNLAAGRPENYAIGGTAGVNSLNSEIPMQARTRGQQDIDLMRKKFIAGEPIEWVRVHNLPDFVWFNHSAHVREGIECEECHGDCATYPVMKQFADLTMGWCVNCHRDKNKLTYQEGEKKGEKRFNAPLHCSACHH